MSEVERKPYFYYLIEIFPVVGIGPREAALAYANRVNDCTAANSTKRWALFGPSSLDSRCHQERVIELDRFGVRKEGSR